MKHFKIILVSIVVFFMSACNYLDIVPDNVATIDFAFRLRSQAKKYLYTCYSYLPRLGSWSNNPGMLTGDEIWFYYPNSMYINSPPDVSEVARGSQNKLNPYLNYWDGSRGGSPLFQAIRNCNTFLANIDKVPDMESYEKDRWKAEVTFLKAYYNWFLLRMYGPIPILDKNLPVSSSPDEVKFYRQPVDSCFNYIVGLIDSSLTNLPMIINDQVTEMGRITKPIALSIKARILVTAASPFYNGNSDYANMVDNRGVHLFNTKFDENKWEKAVEACKDAIDLCQSLGKGLYHFNPSSVPYTLNDTLTTQLSIRTAITEEWNSEVIWGASNSRVGVVQRYAQARLNPALEYTAGTRAHATDAPTLKIAELFYTNHGVPINQDKTWDYDNKYQLKTATQENKFRIKPGYTTAALNFKREPRFYADLGFDGGIWYGQGRFDPNDLFHVESKLGQLSGKSRSSNYSITGYYAKKLVDFKNTAEAPKGAYSYKLYPYPIMRMADLYLLYAEALNEANETPPADAYTYINLVRERAGIPRVQDAWSQYSTNPNEYKSKDGFRKIVHQERLIELALEGWRYWDLLRWKDISQEMNEPVRGWDILQQDETFYYQPTILYQRSFKKKDYLWPIADDNIIKNGNLLQNPGW